MRSPARCGEAGMGSGWGCLWVPMLQLGVGTGSE